MIKLSKLIYFMQNNLHTYIDLQRQAVVTMVTIYMQSNHGYVRLNVWSSV